MVSRSSGVRVYGGGKFLHTAMVRHLGATVVFAMDDSRRIFYSVLDLDRRLFSADGADLGREVALDTEFWSEDPVELRFPSEIARAGYALAGAVVLPRVKRGVRAEAPSGEALGAEETDGFLSSTARLTASAPFQAVSDGRHLYVFRQSVGVEHEDALFRLAGGGCSGVGAREDVLRDAVSGQPVPVVRDALLCDRFVLVGGELKPVLEVRYRRSRNRTVPDSAKDGLGTRDMDGNDFHEPTLELDFAGRVSGGRFAALLLPTAVHDVQRWQFFVHNSQTGRIDALNVEQGKDGLFNTQGTRFYTSPNPQYQGAVLERSAGICPFTKKALVPVPGEEGFAESALEFSGVDAYVQVDAVAKSLQGGGRYTIEAWISPTAVGRSILLSAGVSLRIDDMGKLCLSHIGSTAKAVSSLAVPVADGYVHIAAVYDGVKGMVYVDGKPGTSVALPRVPGGMQRLLIGADSDAHGKPGAFFQGVIDEVRLWDRDRRAEELERDRSYRLIGDEPGLVGYYRCDEGSGRTLYDQTDTAAHGTLHGGLKWVTSGAPVGDHPGVRKESFSVPEHTVSSGLAAVVYYQQEDAVTGHSSEPRPLKKHARVLLTWAAQKEAGSACLAALDMAVARDGRLTQLPDVVTLPKVGEPAKPVDAQAISALEDDIGTLKAELHHARASCSRAEADQKQLPEVLARLVVEKGAEAQAYRMFLMKFPAETAAQGSSKGKPVYLAVQKGDEGTGVLALTDDHKTPGAVWVLINETDTTQTGEKRNWVAITNLLTGMRLHCTNAFTAGLRDRSAPWAEDEMFGFVKKVDSRFGIAAMQAKRLLKAAEGKLSFIQTRSSDDGTAVELNNVDTSTLLHNAQQAVAKLKVRAADLQRGLEAKQQELGRLTDGLQGRSVLSVLMPYLGRDRLGLGYSGALLAFARTSQAPALLESGSGNVGVYFRDHEGCLTAVQYDTTVARSTKRIATDGAGSIVLAARDSGIDLRHIAIEVTASKYNDRCTVTLRERNSTSADDQEVWPLVPRQADRMVGVLNGAREEPVALGTVAKVSGSTLTLASPVGRSLSAGSLLRIERRVYVVDVAAADDATEIRLAADGTHPPAVPGALVHLVSYDPTLVRQGRAGAAAVCGSRLVSAALAGPSASVPDGTAVDLNDTRPTRWWSDLPGRTLSFASSSRPPTLPNNRHRAIGAADDLTLEAWVQPSPGGFARLVHANVADSQYTLALGEKTRNDGGRPLVVGVGNRFVSSRDTVPDDEWTHVAAAYEQSWAVRFAGAASLEVAHTEALNLTRDLTLEVFLQVESLGAPQGLMSKGRIEDGRGEHVPYQLSLDAQGHLVLAMETADSGVLRFTSTATLTPGTFHRVAVVRKSGQSLQELQGNKDVTVIDARGEKFVYQLNVIESVLMEELFDVRFYIDGNEVGLIKHLGAPLGNQSPLEIGCAWEGTAPQHFAGWISEARIWSTAREAAQLGTAVAGREHGLIAHWRFEENEGKSAHDETGSHPAQLRGATWAKNPDPRGSTFRLYLNGRPASASPSAASGMPDTGAYGNEQFALAGRYASGVAKERYKGKLEEVRIWRTARTEENILDNLFTRLRGEKEDLLAYYPFDDDSTEPAAQTLRDHGLRSCDLKLPKEETARPAPVMSTAPISGDTAEVRPVFTKANPHYAQTVTGSPAVTEYTDLQRDAQGGRRGVLKRCYSFLQDGTWHLVTGYKVGNLVSEWVGQAQFAPQVIGYIEGAPPVPSENLIATKNPRNFSYINASTVEFVQADHVVSTLSSSRERGINAAFGLSLAKEVDLHTLMITAPLGMGIAKPVAEGGIDIKGGGSIEFTNAWGDETEVSQGSETARTTSVGLSGGWEDPDSSKQLNAFNGQRFVPANTGYALVQSETADIYALRLAHNHALVSYRILPNPDIPRDWNILPFPLNPRYVKQGTLDGTVGLNEEGSRVRDNDYKDAPENGEHSYFKPREAYALKRRITEEQQRLQAHYDAVSTETHHEDPTADRARKLLGDFIGPITKPAQDGHQQPQAARGFACRNIANTYAWSADGGFFAETTQTTDAVTETTSGSYDLTGSASFSVSGGVKIFGIGATLQVDASIGGALHRTRARTQEATRSFGLNVHCDPAGDMQKYDTNNNPLFDENGNPVEVPGRVDAYRFMTFYLDTDKDNFEDLYGKVIDPQWLNNSDSPYAAALRQARQDDKKPACWRVLHRVTFISRKLPAAITDNAPSMEKAMRAENVSSNYELIRKLEPYVKEHTTSRHDLTTAVRTAIIQHYPNLTPHTQQITDYLALYYEIGQY
ncbi:LamG domain-containing protein [Streptomyces noursei]|uniref:LamG domain-containing protein n=2 Tax=Streptomyces noursei TaxID=1971 RepID=UPI00167B53D9|nr:LamG domain-containing protein [Streptomyces noursei]